MKINFEIMWKISTFHVEKKQKTPHSQEHLHNLFFKQKFRLNIVSGKSCFQILNRGTCTSND